MKVTLRIGLFMVVLALTVAATGCASSGGGYGSDGHYGHSH